MLIRARGDSTEALEIDFIVQSLASAKLQIAELLDKTQRQQHQIKQLQSDANHVKTNASSPKQHTLEDLERRLVAERMHAAETAFLREQSNHQLRTQQKDLKKQLLAANLRTHKTTTFNADGGVCQPRSPRSSPPSPHHSQSHSHSRSHSRSQLSGLAKTNNLNQHHYHLSTCTTLRHALKSPTRTSNITQQELPTFVFRHLSVPIFCFLSIHEILHKLAHLSKSIHASCLPPTLHKWQKRTNLWSHYIEHPHVLTAAHRASLWMLATTGHSKPTSEMMLEYKQLLSFQSQNIYKQDRNTILADVGRTFVVATDTDAADAVADDSLNFPTQGSLRNVLFAYIAHSSSVGYCQGINFVVGVLLYGYTMAYDGTEDTLMLIECATLFTFLGLMKEQARWCGHALYQQGLVHTKTMMAVHEQLIQLFLPKLASHFIKEGVSSDLYAVSWFMTIFTNMTTLPSINSALSVLTSFIINDWKGPHRTALAILKSLEDDLLSKTFSEICILLRSPVDEKTTTSFHGRSFKVTRRMVAKLSTFVQKEEERVQKEQERQKKQRKQPNTAF